MSKQPPQPPEKSQGSRELYQQLLTCLRGSWHSLAVVPAAPQLSASMVASALVDVSNLVRGQQARLFSTEGLEMAGVSKVIVDVTHHVDGGGLAVVVVDSVVAKQPGIPMTLAADAALLVVHLGATKMERSEERRVGKECRRLCRSRWSPYH
jgi:hypothetical protein